MSQGTEILVVRPSYIARLKQWQGQTDLVKIVTGVRRCGKSKLLQMFQSELMFNKVAPESIISLNLEDPVQTDELGLQIAKNGFLNGYEIVLKHILNQVKDQRLYYVFIDEVQLLNNWQKLANGLRMRGNIDVYLTGSNAYMFSSDIANSFGGRYIEIKMQPLTFSEYFSAYHIGLGHEPKTREEFQHGRSIYDIYLAYLRESGFPQVQQLIFRTDQQIVTDYLVDTVYRNTVQKDIIKRFNIGNDNKLDAVIRYMFDNIGRETSLRGIERGLRAGGRMATVPTIDTYVKGLLDSFLMYKCDQYDIKGKQILNTEPKYYVVDVGLRAAVIGQKDADMGRILENVVYLELIHRGYNVSVGKIKKFVTLPDGTTERRTIEVDFVAQKPGGLVEYYQVAYTAKNPEVIAREMAPLKAIRDNHPKILLTMDPDESNDGGIKRVNALRWLLDTQG